MAEVYDNGDWQKRLLMWNWHDTVLKGYPGWELDRKHEPFGHTFTTVNKKDKSSHDLAIAWDDVAMEPFYYRDFTDSSLPFVDEGEAYRSTFWFATRAERDRFVELKQKSNGD